MRNVLIGLSLLSASLLVSQPARALLDPQSGLRVSLAATQTLLSAPLLPSLGSKENPLQAQLSYIGVKMSGTDTEHQLDYSGDFTGGAVGFGYSSRVKEIFNFFLNAHYTELKGTAGTGPSAPSPLHQFTTSGGAAMTGIGARLIGEDDSALAVGAFGGAGVMSFKSELAIDSATYNSTPFIYGPLGGAQVRLKLGSFSVRPYGFYFRELSPVCKQVTSPLGTVSTGNPCPGTFDKTKLDASFTAYGLILGYGSFSLNVYSKTLNSNALSDLAITHYSLSATF
jgi:hypothetical protein